MLELINLQGTLFLLIAVGFIIKKIQLISDDGQRCITDLVINVILPCNIIQAFCVDFDTTMKADMITVFILSVAIQAFCVFYGRAIFHRQSEERKKCLEYGIICSNAGFLGNPVAEGVFGAYGLMLASVFLIPLRVMMWTEGIALFSGSKDVKSTVKRTITHPCILACIVGIIMLITGFRFPKMISDTIQHIGACNTALSMLAIGMILTDIRKKDFSDKTAWVYTLHRLVVLPMLLYGITALLPLSPTARGIAVLLTAMPAGATTSILSAKYKVEPVLGAKLVILSTLLSLPTLTVWSLILAA